MDKCIIFGCGYIGRAAYNKLKDYYEIFAWADNDERLHGRQIYGIPVIFPYEITELSPKPTVFVSALETASMVGQLRKLGISDVYVWKGGFFYSAEGLFPLEFRDIEIQKKDGQSSKHILFVSDCAGIRDHKMASIAKMAGCKVFHAYLVMGPNETDSGFADIYEKIIPIMSINALFNYVRDSEFDLIHCSSEPEYVTPILSKSGKRIIHDCHDLRSDNQVLSADKLTLEYMAYTCADGVIYPTEKLRRLAVKKYDLNIDKTFVLGNYPTETIVTKKHEKLGNSDGVIHCVYEGRITYGNEKCRRYFEKIWLKIVKSGVHIHFYTQCEEAYCRYLESLDSRLHYEGNLNSHELAGELSKYDVGLCIFNTNPTNQLYLECSSPIKLFEYVNSGVPVAVGSVDEHIRLVGENGWGGELDLDGDIKSQLETISRIRIEDSVLKKKGYTYEENKDELISFYDKVIG